jgi:hypothetical protein
MEEGSHVWLRSPKSEWGWLPAKIIRKEVVLAVATKSELKTSGSKVVGGADNGSGLKDAYGRYRTSAAAVNTTTSLSSSVGSGGVGGKVGGGGGDPDPLPKSSDDANDNDNDLICGSQAEGGLTQPAVEVEAALQSDKQQLQQQQQQEQTEDVEKENDDKVDPTVVTPSPEDTMIELTLVDDFDGLRLEGNNAVVVATGGAANNTDNSTTTTIASSGQKRRRKQGKSTTGDYYANAQPFTEIVRIASNALVTARGEEHPDIKLRNIPMTQYGPPSSSSLSKNNKQADGSKNNDNSDLQSTSTAALTMMIQDTVTGGVDDLIGLTHLHEPAILHAIRLRYDADIIYTSTGPILLAINPFKVSREILVGVH